MSSNVDLARAAIAQAKSIAILTGAGVSAESGIPTFRSNGGFWKTTRFQDLATAEGFQRDPAMVWQWYEERRCAVAAAHPNAGHYALAQMEARAHRFTLITQNVDDLHIRAGSNNILRLHGDIFVVRCLCCLRERVEPGPLTQLPPRCDCGGMLRPGVVWFGEVLPEGSMESAAAAVEQADVFLVIGTSAQVYPAAGLIPQAIRSGCTVIEVNAESTGFSDSVNIALRGTAAVVLPLLL